MGKIFWLIVLIVVAVALYNTFTHLSGSFKFENLSSIIRLPGSPVIRSTSTISVPAPVNNGTNYYSSSNNNNVGTSPTQGSPEPVKPQIVPPTGFTLNQLSPYYGQVNVDSPSQGSYYIPSQFSIRADYSLKTPIDITGWSVKSNKSILFLPKAVNDYNPSGLNPSGDILLASGDYANFYSNYSPIGVSLRLNSCTGYLNRTYSFNPALPENCASAYSRSEITTFSGACQSLILSLGGCTVPSPDQINSLPDTTTGCKPLLSSRFSYNGCYNYHRNDADFFSHEWRVWLQSQMNFDWSHDRLLLFDKNNLLVDEYYY